MLELLEALHVLYRRMVQKAKRILSKEAGIDRISS